jgi:hypothetical protein
MYVLRRLVCEIYVTVKFDNILIGSFVCHGNTCRIVTCTQDTQYIAGVSCDRMNMECTCDEYCDMLLTPGTCNGRAGAAAREYALCYPGRRYPDIMCFDGWSSVSVRQEVQHLQHTGMQGAHGLYRHKSMEVTVTAAVEREPWRSLRVMARELGLSQTRALEEFRDDELHPYQHSRSARLFPDDRPLRMQFCEWLYHQHFAEELFSHKILYKGESCFTHKGVFNAHNSHFWARHNPHVFREYSYQVCFSISF